MFHQVVQCIRVSCEVRHPALDHFRHLVYQMVMYPSRHRRHQTIKSRLEKQTQIYVLYAIVK